jgi:hypothetical protein
MLHTTLETGTVALVGYLGATGSDGYRRLYEDPAGERYVGILADDIVDVSTADSMPGQSLIRVRRDASVIWHEPMPASAFGPGPTTPRGYKWPRP